MEHKLNKTKKIKIILNILIIFFVLILFIGITFAYLSNRETFFSDVTLGTIEIDSNSGESTQSKIGYTVTRDGVSGQNVSVIMPGDEVNVNVKIKLTDSSEPAYYLVKIEDEGDLGEVFNGSYFYKDSNDEIVYVSELSLTKACGEIEPDTAEELNLTYTIPLSYSVANAHISLSCKICAVQRANITASSAYYLIDEISDPVGDATITTSALTPYKGAESTTTEIGFYKYSNMPEGYTLDADKTTALQSTLTAENRDKISIYTNGTKVAFVSKGAIYAPASCYCLFYNATNLTSIDFVNFNTSNVTGMPYMFQGCSNLTYLNVSGFNTSNVLNMDSMFYNCSRLTTIDVSNFNTSKVTSMGYMFCGCGGLTSLDISGFDTSNVTNMSSMFAVCQNLTYLDVSGFNTSKVTNMSGMFRSCIKLANLDVSNFDTRKATNLSTMFYGCYAATNLNLRNFDFTLVTSLQWFVYRCGTTNLDFSGCITSNLTNLYQAFTGISNLNLTGWDLSNVTNWTTPFSNNVKITCSAENKSLILEHCTNLSDSNFIIV